jgi:hypothetical protein
VKGVVWAGFSNMNPAIVTIWISPGERQHTQVTIQGKAKEGLIKQHAGEEAAVMIAQQITAQLT